MRSKEEVLKNIIDSNSEWSRARIFAEILLDIRDILYGIYRIEGNDDE